MKHRQIFKGIGIVTGHGERQPRIQLPSHGIYLGQSFYLYIGRANGNELRTLYILSQLFFLIKILICNSCYSRFFFAKLCIVYNQVGEMIGVVEGLGDHWGPALTTYKECQASS